MEKEYILCAAIWHKDFSSTTGLPINLKTGLVICGRRHADCIHTYWKFTGLSTDSSAEQGFMTSRDRFVNRKEGYEIAESAGQIMDGRGDGRTLFSEDLY